MEVVPQVDDFRRQAHRGVKTFVSPPPPTAPLASAAAATGDLSAPVATAATTETPATVPLAAAIVRIFCLWSSGPKQLNQHVAVPLRASAVEWCELEPEEKRKVFVGGG